MAKELSAIVKLQIKGGAANPSPPIGPALGAKGVNIMEFCKQFNARTQDQAGKILPVMINVYTDKSFDFVVKRPPVAIQIMEVTKVKAGSPTSNRKKVGSITWDQIKTIAEDKIVDMNCFTIESAMNMVAGTAAAWVLQCQAKGHTNDEAEVTSLHQKLNQLLTNKNKAYKWQR